MKSNILVSNHIKTPIAIMEKFNNNNILESILLRIIVKIAKIESFLIHFLPLIRSIFNKRHS